MALQLPAKPFIKLVQVHRIGETNIPLPRATQSHLGTDVPDIDEPGRVAAPPTQQKTAVYTRVSSAENKANLDSQAERLVKCAARGKRANQEDD